MLEEYRDVAGPALLDDPAQLIVSTDSRKPLARYHSDDYLDRWPEL